MGNTEDAFHNSIVYFPFLLVSKSHSLWLCRFFLFFSISTFRAPRQHWSRQDKLSTIHHFFLFFPSALPHYLLSMWNRQDQIHIITLFYTLRCYWNLDLTDDIYQACTTFSQRPYLAFWTILHVLTYNPHPLPNFQV